MSSYPPTPGDTLIFENDRVRVWSMTLEADGGMFDFHQHHHDHLVIWPDAGEAEAQELGDDTWPVRQSAEPGFCMFKTVGSGGPMTPHRIRNAGSTAVTHYVVELIGEESPSPVTLDAQTNDRGRISHPGLSTAGPDDPPS
ncbi:MULTISPECIES: hypothetical protein [unclassified Pseudonocardia]|uniref:hypothetical protein n=1 Tax=unclassified Pseudonocardia TaxID=2619320 RepID=UPI0001FFEDD8|nr:MULTISPECIES: hypothetical protein [unclassified Pseudonocardia]ALE73804.1 hypothetical protein FRP1_13480 [Pseudonocardia sp. EC080625-04]ALL77198.1 hypothetical protein AD006_21160 [Pseudonocardia sp. EC080610-09]ALL80112.1 hypothetical protein AD017_00740 [Pseudonocardia sp. EC080619-01]OLM18253.1 hypothetical protein Ae707Ps1_2512c [Pseudonocardia sp. Ae707_Ps1]